VRHLAALPAWTASLGVALVRGPRVR